MTPVSDISCDWNSGSEDIYGVRSCQSWGMMETMLKNVAVVIINGFTPFELGVVCEVFGVDRTDDGLPAYDFAVVSGETAAGADTAPLASSAGFTVSTPYGLDRLREADLVAVAAVSDDQIGAARPASSRRR